MVNVRDANSQRLGSGPQLLLSEDDTLSGNLEYQKECHHVQVLKAARDLEALISLSKTAPLLSGTNPDPNAVFALEAAIADAISDGDFGPANAVRQRQIGGQLALALLAQPSLPIDTAAQTVPILYAADYSDYQSGDPPVPDWAIQRTAHARIWLRILERLDVAIKPLPATRGVFSEDDSLVIGLPAESTYAAQRRAGQEREVAERADTLAQHDLRLIRQQYTPDMERALCWLYSQSPQDDAGLTKLFIDYSTEPSIRDAVRAKIAATAN